MLTPAKKKIRAVHIDLVLDSIQQPTAPLAQVRSFDAAARSVLVGHYSAISLVMDAVTAGRRRLHFSPAGCVDCHPRQTFP